MSIKVLNWVLWESEVTANDRMVLVVLADVADDEGRGCYLSRSKIARKARIGERTVADCLKRLRERGAIEREGVKPGLRGVVSYRVVMTCAEPAQVTDAGPAQVPVQPAAHKPSLTDVGREAGKPASLPPSKTKQKVEGLEADWQTWLGHYRETTGRPARGSTAAREMFIARRREDWPLEDLQLATVGCHADKWRRERGLDKPTTILRKRNVESYYLDGVEMARTDRGNGASREARALRDRVQRELEERERRKAAA